MHEASLMVSLMRGIDEIARRERARRITGVSVRLGALSHMSPEHFTEHFERASAGTIAEGARLEIALSTDIADAKAQEILVEKVEVEV